MTKQMNNMLTGRQKVEIVEYPISDRYCHKGETGTVENGQIRVNGTWFNFNDRWVVKPLN